MTYSLHDPVIVTEIIGEHVEHRAGVVVGLTHERDPRYDVRLDIDGSIIQSLPAARIRPMPKREVA